jgi:hypothetical protein
MTAENKTAQKRLTYTQSTGAEDFFNKTLSEIKKISRSLQHSMRKADNLRLEGICLSPGPIRNLLYIRAIS